MKTIASEKITITRRESNFDKACDEAYNRAVMAFGIDDDGHSKRVKAWERSECCIQVTFVSYNQVGGMGGHSYNYEFLAEAIKG